MQMMRFYTTARYPKTAVPVKVQSINRPRKMRAMLEVLAPQVHPGDHETTADVLHTGSCESLAVELIRLLIYFESNDMIDQFEELLGFKVRLGIPENMMNFLKELGFLNKANLDWLAGCTDPTSETFLNRLLAHAIIDENSFDILKLLIPNHFSVDHPLKISRQQWYGVVMRPPRIQQAEAIRAYRPNVTLLVFSCFAGNINAVRLLLDLGADPYDTSVLPNPAPLEYAASLTCHERATAITSLLLSKQTRSSAQARNAALEGALQLAIAESNTGLIMKLLAERERVGGGSICSQHLTLAAQHADSATIRLLVDNAPRNGDGHIQLPEDILFSAISDINRRPRHTRGYDELLEKFNYLLNLGVNPAISRCRYGCVGSFFLEFLLRPEVAGGIPSIRDEGISKMAEAVRKHGCPPERPKSTSKGNAGPSTLQLAIRSGYTQLVKYLLDWGADIDFLNDMSKSAAPRHKDCQCKHQSYSTKGCSPLLTALEYGQIEIAKILLRHRPNLKLRGGELLLAIRNCEPEVVAMLLLAESPTDDEWKTCFQRAVSMRKPQLIEMLLPKNSNSRAEIDPLTTMRAALVTGDFDKAYQMATVCGYDSRTLFESVLQSHGEGAYHTIVDRLLQMRPNTPNDDFEIRAVAYAAIHHDTYLLNCLMKSFGQGPWIADFPPKGDCYNLSEWEIDRDRDDDGIHILSFAAELCGLRKDDKALKALLQANVSAKGSYIRYSEYLSEETLRQMIASGLDPNQPEFLFAAVRRNMLMNVRALCEAKVDMNAFHSSYFYPESRAAIQVAVEKGSPEMLEMLLHYGADVDHPSGYFRGAICLQLAAGAGNIGLVRLLINKGAKVNAKRSLLDGRTAVEIAAENGRLDVLKLLFLQEQHLFRTAAERYQFIRAAKMAEQNGHEVIGKMLRQHIHWNRKDQGLFDDMPGTEDSVFHLDDMTQRVTESEKCDGDFWQHIRDCCRVEGLPGIHNIDGIEQWVGEIPDEYFSDYSDSESETNFSSEGEASVHSTDTFATARQQGAGRDELASGCGHHSDFLPMHDNADDTMGWSEDSKFDTTNEQPGARIQATSMDPVSGQGETALAPLAIRWGDRVPTWLDMEDTTYGSAGVAVLEDSEHQSSRGNQHQECGMVLGEVQGSHTSDPGGNAFGVINAYSSGEIDHSGYFDWGFWDEEGIGREVPGLETGIEIM